MKTLIKTFRILNVGFLLGSAFIMWLYSEEIEKGKKELEKQKLVDEYGWLPQQITKEDWLANKGNFRQKEQSNA